MRSPQFVGQTYAKLKVKPVRWDENSVGCLVSRHDRQTDSDRESHKQNRETERERGKRQID